MGERRTCPTCGESYAADVIFCPRDGAPLGGRKTELADDAYLGLELAGQFRLEQLIGIGAMGRVYRAHQAGIGRDVAVKVLHRELLTNEILIKRFHQEAKVASRLLHPNVVQVLMTGALPHVPGTPVGGEAYLVMEYLDGISLRSGLAAVSGAMPLPRALHIVLQVCDAVGEAHANQIVHRDIKPENVMLVRRGDDPDFVKVLDFGVAKIDLGEDSVATQAGAVFGTARYVSPEGARGERVGPAGDVYALATLLFQTLSGTTPFDGESPVSILIKHTSTPAPDVRSVARSSYVPAPIAQVIADNLRKQAGERAPDARAFGRALIDAARQSGLSPEELTLRSTLLGASSTLGLASLQRTKSLGLTPELAAQMRGETAAAAVSSAKSGAAQANAQSAEARPSAAPATLFLEPSDGAQTTSSGSPQGSAPKTQILEDTEAAKPTQITPPSAAAASDTRLSAAPTPAPDSDPGSLRPVRLSLTSRPSHPAPEPPPGDRDAAPRPSAAPEPAPQLSQLASQTDAGPVSSRHPREAPWSVHPRDSLPTVEPLEVSHGEARSFRPLVLALCFVLGAGLSFALAYRLGVFDQKGLSAETYVTRANTALEAERWDSPPGDNVREITGAALQRWPKHPGLLEVRRKAAARLTALAEAKRAEPEEAHKLLSLATELDPNHQPARLLLSELAPQFAPDAAIAPAPSTEPATQEARPRPKPAAAPSPAPSGAPSAAPAPSSPQGAPAASAGGRWL